MFIKVSNQSVGNNSRSYVDLFRGLKGIKEGGYKSYRDGEVILPDGFKLNTLVLQVEDETNKPQEIVVDYLGNELVVSDEQRRELTPELLKHLEMIGRAMFSPDSQENLVINSRGARALTNTSYIENSPRAKVENSNWAKVENSGGAKVENSNWAKVENSDWAKVENSEEAKVENSDWAKVENSEEAKVENSEEAKVENSPDVRMINGVVQEAVEV